MEGFLQLLCHQHALFQRQDFALETLGACDQIVVFGPLLFQMVPGARAEEQHQVNSNSDGAEADGFLIAICERRHTYSLGGGAGVAVLVPPTVASGGGAGEPAAML